MDKEESIRILNYLADRFENMSEEDLEKLEREAGITEEDLRESL